MPTSTLYLCALERAALLAGGSQALARTLNVPGLFVDSWIAGRQPVPTGIFLQLIDLLVDNDVKILREKRLDKS